MEGAGVRDEAGGDGGELRDAELGEEADRALGVLERVLRLLRVRVRVGVRGLRQLGRGRG